MFLEKGFKFYVDGEEKNKSES